MHQQQNENPLRDKKVKIQNVKKVSKLQSNFKICERKKKHKKLSSKVTDLYSGINSMGPFSHIKNINMFLGLN